MLRSFSSKLLAVQTLPLPVSEAIALLPQLAPTRSAEPTAPPHSVLWPDTRWGTARELGAAAHRRSGACDQSSGEAEDRSAGRTERETRCRSQRRLSAAPRRVLLSRRCIRCHLTPNSTEHPPHSSPFSFFQVFEQLIELLGLKN